MLPQCWAYKHGYNVASRGLQITLLARPRATRRSPCARPCFVHSSGRGCLAILPSFLSDQFISHRSSSAGRLAGLQLESIGWGGWPGGISGRAHPQGKHCAGLCVFSTHTVSATGLPGFPPVRRFLDSTVVSTCVHCRKHADSSEFGALSFTMHIKA